jgi:chemotaxis protein MotB
MSAPSTRFWIAPSRGRPERRRPLPAALLLCALLAPGCVSRGTHERVVGGLRDQIAELEEQGRDKDRSIAALQNERDKLLAEIEDLRDARESLKHDVSERETTLRRMRGNYDDLVKELEQEVAASQLRIDQLTEGLGFNLPEDVLFGPGSAELTPAGVKAVREVASRIQGRTELVEVRGHTDDRPISGALAQRYPTNWELAGARAASVVRVLEQSGVDPARLTAVSYGSARPLASNDTPEGRAQNRRIEVRLVPLPSTLPETEGKPAAAEGGEAGPATPRAAGEEGGAPRDAGGEGARPPGTE